MCILSLFSYDKNDKCLLLIWFRCLWEIFLNACGILWKRNDSRWALLVKSSRGAYIRIIRITDLWIWPDSYAYNCMNKSGEILNIMRSLVFWEITCCHFELMNSYVQSPCSYHSATYSTYAKSLKYFMWYFLENKIISSPYNLTFCCLPYLLSVKPYRINHLSNPVNLRNSKSDIAHGAVMEWNHNSAHLNPFNFSFLPWIEV